MNSKILALDSILSYVKLASISKLLDVGCGTGDLTIFVANKLGIKQIYGVDADKNALSKAKEKGIVTFKLDISNEKFPFPDETFDLVLLLDVIEHVENPDNAIKEIHRVLRRRGSLLLTTPNMAAWYNRLLLLFGKPILGIDLSKEIRYQYPFGVTQVISGHQRLYAVDSLKEILKFHGFEVKKIKGYSLKLK
jgi:methionine biosynthesis protein MetW